MSGGLRAGVDPEEGLRRTSGAMDGESEDAAEQEARRSARRGASLEGVYACPEAAEGAREMRLGMRSVANITISATTAKRM